MQTQNAIEFYKEVLEIVNQGYDATIKRDKSGRLVIYVTKIKKYKKEINTPN